MCMKKVFCVNCTILLHSEIYGKILIPNKKLSNKKGQLESDVLSLNSRVDPKKVLPYRIFTTFQPF